MLLFELLTGEKPFPGTSMTEIMYKVLHEHPRELSDVNHLAPVALNNVVRKALAKDPTDRFQHAADFYNALEHALEEGAEAAAAPIEEDPDLGATVVISPRAPVAGAPDVALTAVDSELLKKVEEDLAVYMGPIAKILVKKAAKKSSTAEELSQRLVGVIPDERQGEEFLKRVKRTLGQPSLGTSEPPPAADTMVRVLNEPLDDASLPGTPLFSKDLLKTVERQLAEHLGPIAKILVKKAAKKSDSLDALYDQLAEHLSSEAERKAFLAGKPEA